jgi:LysR substrate binding domain
VSKPTPFPLDFHRGDESLAVEGQTVVAVNESTSHLSALLTGMGIGQTFRFMAAPHLARGELRTVLDDWTRLRHPLHLVYPNNRHLNSKLRLLPIGSRKSLHHSTIERLRDEPERSRRPSAFGAMIIDASSCMTVERLLPSGDVESAMSPTVSEIGRHPATSAAHAQSRRAAPAIP